MYAGPDGIHVYTHTLTHTLSLSLSRALSLSRRLKKKLYWLRSSEVNAGLPSLHVRGATDTVIPQGVQVAGVPGAAGLALNVSLLAGARGASSSYPGIYIYMGLRVEVLDFRL